MRVNVAQLIADKRRMEEYVAKRIRVDETIRIELATGTWADLYSTWDDYFGWVLHWETNDPEWVDIYKARPSSRPWRTAAGNFGRA